MTVAAPSSVTNVVSRMFVPGRYRRLTSYGGSGTSVNDPPRRASRSAPKTVGESTEGKGSQSIEPSRATSATVRPSPIAA
jgi:hypothetical protein